ncbi:unnamed protein product (macronuclear) [Paramecium tetraurelia]|uniref:Uncharacterized protein n=1 Tax=Paramecium tetraurelia TaxID=5888 RepID=A0CLK8_PARTE|nr:uncharacterized protein GSPATT00008224001 [Paramecium tetraurelia]CAK71675.1 unnamed protein product [Paramecium tetraurelia]|eukprot:XP_001439072.1 hypothetical protein (macronuclear) [Paramecium tetraurelia strain d4-2]
MQCWIHEDYCTYLTYNKISITNSNINKLILEDECSNFEEKTTDYIILINELFAKKMLDDHQNIQQKIQMDIDNLQLFEIIERISDSKEILTQEEIEQIYLNFNKYKLDIIEKQYQNVQAFIQTHYTDFLQQSVIQQPQYPQELRYENYGNNLEILKSIEKYIKIQETDETKLHNLQRGLYHLRLKKGKKMFIILEITSKKKQNAYIINYFQHYKEASQIIHKLQNNFNCYYIRTIKLQKAQEAYLICKHLKLKNEFQQKQNQIIEIYRAESFQQINLEIENIMKFIFQTQQMIRNFMSKIINNSKDVNQIYTLNFVKSLREKKALEITLIERIQFNQNIKSIQYQPSMLGAILEDQNKITQGVVLYFNRRIILFFLNNLQYNYQQELEKEPNKFVKIINTKVKNIEAEAAQFYITLLLKNQTKNVARDIKSFLEQKTTAWVSILKFLEEKK